MKKLLLALVIVSLFIIGCSSKDKELIGQWEVVESGGFMTVEVLPDNTYFIPPIPLLDFPSTKGTWERRGSKICTELLFEGENLDLFEPECFEYSLDEGYLTTGAFTLGPEIVLRKIN